MADEKFIRLMSMHEEHLPILMNILQSRYESMMHTIENMTLTCEEQKELDEKLRYIKKLQQTIKDNKIE
ncbi:MAG: hypothetical protein J6X37_01410, partial [Treponema sp.]|nr:hypothetical protein [Treponema sp.]